MRSSSVAEPLRIRIRRRLFAGVSVLSLILCLATVGLWVRSCVAYDAVVWGQSRAVSVSGRSYFVSRATDDSSVVEWRSYPLSDETGADLANQVRRIGANGSWWNRLGL